MEESTLTALDQFEWFYRISLTSSDMYLISAAESAIVRGRVLSGSIPVDFGSMRESFGPSGVASLAPARLVMKWWYRPDRCLG